MIDEIYEYLDNVTSPEKSLIYKEACNILISIDPQRYGLALMIQYDGVSNITTDMFLGRFESLLIDSLCNELAEFGLYMTEEFTLENYIPELKNLLLTMYGLEDYQDPEELSLLVETITNEKETIGELARTIVSDKVDIDKIMEITEVSPSLIKRIRERLNEMTIVPMGNDVVIDTVGVERLNRWLTIYPSAYINKMLSDGLKPGSPFDNYVDYMFNYLDNEPDLETVARTLILMAVAANIPNDKIKELMGVALEQIFIDGMKIIQIMRLINNWVMVDD